MEGNIYCHEPSLQQISQAIGRYLHVKIYKAGIMGPGRPAFLIIAVIPHETSNFFKSKHFLTAGLVHRSSAKAYLGVEICIQFQYGISNQDRRMASLPILHSMLSSESH
jgi:hypothetical protein